MAGEANSARRALLKAIPFLGAASVLPAVSAVTPTHSAAQRAHLHWAEFAKAMDELTADANGWRVDAGNRDALSGTDGHYLKVATVRRIEDEAYIYERVEPFTINV